MTEQFFSLGEVADLLGVAPYRIAYAIATKALPEPVFRVANKRAFTTDDVDRAARHFCVPNPSQAANNDNKGER